MYRNERNGTFVQVTGTDYTSLNVNFGLCGPYGDIDNDGDEDLILIPWLSTSSFVYMNDGYGNFSKVGTIDRAVNSQFYFLDMDGDSFPDLIDLNSAAGKIYPNDGLGNFPDFEPLTITPPISSASLLPLTFGDADNDGDFDLFYGYTWNNGANYTKNTFYLNDGSGSFVKEPDTSIIISTLDWTNSINWVDYDNDNDMDLYVMSSSIYGSQTQSTGVMYENKGGLNFEKHLLEPNPYYSSHKMTSMWGDLDNDGDLDLYVTVDTNDYYGHVSPLRHNLLFQNNGDGSFSEVEISALTDMASHTCALEDFDNDSDLDVLLVGFVFADNGKNYLCENSGNSNSWIEITCEGTHSGKSAYGAHINAISTINGKRVIQTREITPVTGHNTTFPSSRIHFGLGDATMVDTLLIRWPKGNIDTLTNLKANQFYRAIEDSILEIDFKATSYIKHVPVFMDTMIYDGENLSLDLSDYYELVKGDTFPGLQDENLSFSVYKNDNEDAAIASVDGNILSVVPGTTSGISEIQVLASAGFTGRVDGFRVEYKKLSALTKELDPKFRVYSNPVTDRLSVEFEKAPGLNTTIQLVDISGKVLFTEMPDPADIRYTVNLTGIAGGIYFLKIQTVEYTVVKKVVKN